MLSLVQRNKQSEDLGLGHAGAPGAADDALRNQTIHAIYQSVLEPTPWRSALSLMVAYFGANNATIVVRPSTAVELGYLVAVPGNEAAELEYRSIWHKLDPFSDLPSERVLTVANVMSERQWRSSPYYRDFLRHKVELGAGHVMGVNFMTRAGTVTRLRLSRASEHPPFSEDDKRRLAMLVPHIKQATTLSAHVSRNESEREIYEEGLDRLNIGVIVLDETALLLRANSVASRLLSRGDGIRLAGRRLEASDPSDARALDRLFSSAREQPGVVAAMLLSRPSGLRKLTAVVRCIPRVEESEGKAQPSLAIFLRDPNAPACAAQDIASQLLGLTPAEAGLAIELVNGLSLDEAAVKLGIKRNTVRAHLRAIFSKTGVTRQSELVRIMLNGVLGLAIAEN